jgi:hypothetical protein
MLGIALDFGGAAVFDSDQDAAGVRAVVRAGGMDDVLHPRIIKDSVETGLCPVSRRGKGDAEVASHDDGRDGGKIMPRRRKESESRDRKRKSDSLIV